MQDDSPRPAAPSSGSVIRRLDDLWATQPPLETSQISETAPRRIGRFVIDRVIGHGSFGLVWLAIDPELDRRVALKVPRHEILADAEHLERFRSEAQVAAKLEHPAIVPLLEAHLDGPVPYIASAYCPGPDLALWLQDQDRPVPWREAVRLIIDLADALHYAHGRGVIHRDVKPSNVMLVPADGVKPSSECLDDFRPRLTDFGLAKHTANRLTDTRSSVVMGTPLYLPPEAFSKESDRTFLPAMDVYSLGCILYELIAGRLPIEGESYVEIVDELRERTPEPLRRICPSVPRSLEAIAAKCLEKNPEARYATAAELSGDLKACLQDRPVRVEKPGAWMRFRYWMRQPKRMRDAGLFCLGFHLLSSLWLIACTLIVLPFGLLDRQEYVANLQDVLLVLITFDAPAILIAWRTLLGKRWAVRAGVVLSALQVVFLSLAFGGGSQPFENVYRNAEYHQAANYALILGCTAVQLALYGFAWVADRQHWTHRS